MSPGFGSLSLAFSIIVVICYCQFRVRKNDTEHGQGKGNWQLNIGSLFVATLALFIILMILKHFVGQDSIAFMHIQLWGLTNSIGVLLPIMIILGNDNMKTYIWNHTFKWIINYSENNSPA